MHGCFSYFSLQPKPLIQLAVLIVPPLAVAFMGRSTSCNREDTLREALEGNGERVLGISSQSSRSILFWSKLTSLKCMTRCRRSSHGQFQTLSHFGQGNFCFVLGLLDRRESLRQEQTLSEKKTDNSMAGITIVEVQLSYLLYQNLKRKKLRHSVAIFS